MPVTQHMGFQKPDEDLDPFDSGQDITYLADSMDINLMKTTWGAGAPSGTARNGDAHFQYSP